MILTRLIIVGVCDGLVITIQRDGHVRAEIVFSHFSAKISANFNRLCSLNKNIIKAEPFLDLMTFLVKPEMILEHL